MPQHDPEYMEQPSPTNDSKHLQEDTERAISRAAAEQEERSPEALLSAVSNNSVLIQTLISVSMLHSEASVPLFAGIHDAHMRCVWTLLLFNKSY